MCIETFTDFHSGSARERTAVALQYSRDYWVTYYDHAGDKLDPGALDKVLEEYGPEKWLSSDSLADDTAFLLWWNDFVLLIAGPLPWPSECIHLPGLCNS